MNPRFPVLLSEFRCAFAAASKRWCEGKNYSAIRVSDIPLSPLKVARRRSFYEVVLGADDAVFSLPALGTPASMRESKANRYMHRHSVPHASRLMALDQLSAPFQASNKSSALAYSPN